MRRVERMDRIKENSDMRLMMAQEKREELESSLRKRYEELIKKKEEARAQMRL
jgi:AAA+ superfamily predicted ATPase